MTKLHDLSKLGQSIWFDFIRRSLITSGELQALVDKGVRGVTSNPTIFEKAIAGSADYDTDLNRLVGEGRSVDEIYETLALDDIAQAADVLRPVYDQTQGADGYVSLEVSPTLAHDTGATVADARRLFAALERPNIMIKVPATPAGIPAIETLIGEGINVNVTLLFSPERFLDVAESFQAGLEDRIATGADRPLPRSVASFFLSRIDAIVDPLLDAGQQDDDASALRGETAIALARMAYRHFVAITRRRRWRSLAAKGASPQRLLWASTGTKDKRLPDTYYIDELIGPDTVNTMPPATAPLAPIKGNSELRMITEWTTPAKIPHIR